MYEPSNNLDAIKKLWQCQVAVLYVMLLKEKYEKGKKTEVNPLLGLARFQWKQL